MWIQVLTKQKRWLGLQKDQKLANLLRSKSVSDQSHFFVSISFEKMDKSCQKCKTRPVVKRLEGRKVEKIMQRLHSVTFEVKLPFIKN